MKNVTTLLVLCCFSAAAFGQSPFTITFNNFPYFGIQSFQGPGAGANLTPAANGNWDYGATHSTTNTNSNYFTETDPFYTNAGVDVYINDFKNLTPALGYIIYNEFDFNNTGVYDKGIYIDPQAYGIGALTGNTLDSIRFPFQGYIYPTARKVMQFPATHQTAWTSQNRRWVNFDISVAAAGLNKTPSQHVFTYFRTDSIAGWGKMRVYANGSPSIQYDVLINKTYQYSVDSFFLGGAPAPPALLTAFGVTQGQQTGVNKRYTVYREGNSTPLAIFLYGSNNYTTPTGIYFDKDNLTQTTGVHGADKFDFATLLFPNPSSSGLVNVQFTGNVPELDMYLVIDLQGRIIQSGKVDTNEGLLQIQLGKQIPNGQYILQVLDNKKQTLVTESFVLEQ